MKYKKIILFIFAVFIVFTLKAYSAEMNVGTKGPIAKFSMPEYKFPDALEGDMIQHTFIVRNLGESELEIQKVRTG